MNEPFSPPPRAFENETFFTWTEKPHTFGQKFISLNQQWSGLEFDNSIYTACPHVLLSTICPLYIICPFMACHLEPYPILDSICVRPQNGQVGIQHFQLIALIFLRVTIPETNMFTAENWWLEDYFLLGRPSFRGEVLVLGMVVI